MRKLCSILVMLATAFGTVTGLLSGGRVLCTGSDQHVAIELRHQVCPSAVDSAQQEPAAISLQGNDGLRPTARAAQSCSDVELAGTVTNRSSISVGAASQQFLVPFCTPAAVWMSSVAEMFEAPVWASPPDDHSPSPSLGCLRSVVLLI